MSNGHGVTGRVFDFVLDESGATAVEYGLIAGLISVAALLALTNLGSSLGLLFDDISNTISAASATGSG